MYCREAHSRALIDSTTPQSVSDVFRIFPHTNECPRLSVTEKDTEYLIRRAVGEPLDIRGTGSESYESEASKSLRTTVGSVEH